MYKYLLAFLIVPGFVYAQKKQVSAIAVANREYSNLRYAYAIPFFKSHIKSKSEDTAALLKLAYCYKVVNQYDSAIYFYEKADQLGGLHDNSLAELYANTGKYNQAAAAYQKLLQQGSAAVDQQLAAKRMAGFKGVPRFMKDSLDYTLYYLSVNTPLNEYSAALYEEGFVFESNRGSKTKHQNEFGWDGTPFSRLYYQADVKSIRTDSIQYAKWQEKTIRKSISDYTAATPNDNEIVYPRFDFKKFQYQATAVPLFSGVLNGGANVGTIAFAADGSVAYFTKNASRAKGLQELEIWRAEKDKMGVWGNLVLLPLNQKGISSFHPAVTPDDKRLYFVSDRPGGKGGTDIYYTDKGEDGKWADPVNAGVLINTAGNELFPTYYEQTLFFSSNGQEGLGGLDIYKVVSGKPVNMGYPVNGAGDDFSYSLKNNTGYFSSNRYGSDDIFAFDYQPAQVQLSGKTTLNQAAGSGLRVRLYDAETGKLVDSALADAQGRYTLKSARPNRPYKLVVDDRAGHIETAQVLADHFNKVGKGALQKELVLVNVSVPPPPVVEKPVTEKPAAKPVVRFIVHYALDRSAIQKSEALVLDSLVRYLAAHPGSYITIGSFTDCAAGDAYNLQLSDKRSTAVKQYLLQHKVAASAISTYQYGKKYLVTDCAEVSYDAKQQAVNRRSEIYVTEAPGKTWEELAKEMPNAGAYASQGSGVKK